MRWLLIVTCAIAVAHADPAAADPDPAPAVRPAAAAQPGTTEQPAAVNPAPAQPAAAPKPPPVNPKDMRTVTDDPALGRAARVTGNEVHGMVAFTFDDGPNPKTTPKVIAALEKYDVPATFFIITSKLLGRHGAADRAVLASELAGGFLVGSHSMHHPHLNKARGRLLDREINQSLRTLAVDAHRPIGLFRPPYGALSGAARLRLRRLGVTEVIWSIDTLDWRARNARRLRRKVIRMIIRHNGGIVLMHDRKRITARILAGVLDDLEATNCKRLANGKHLIVPVSIHYFLRDGKKPRPVPPAVKRRTAAYLAALPGRCEVRAAAHRSKP